MRRDTIWENGIAAAIFAGYAWGIFLAFVRAVRRCPPWSKSQKRNNAILKS